MPPLPTVMFLPEAMLMSPPVDVPAACPLPATSTTALDVALVVEMLSLMVKLPVAVMLMRPIDAKAWLTVTAPP